MNVEFTKVRLMLLKKKKYAALKVTFSVRQIIVSPCVAASRTGCELGKGALRAGAQRRVQPHSGF